MNITEVKKRANLLRLVSFLERAFGYIKLYRNEIIAFIGGFFFEFALIGETRPFGISLLCACQKDKSSARTRVSIFLGIAFGALFVKDGAFIVLSALTAEVVSFVLQRYGKSTLSEKAIPPLCASLIFALISFQKFVIAAIVISVFSLGFSGLFQKSRAFSPALADSGFLCLAFAVSLTLSSLSISVLSFGVVVSVFFCFEGGFRGGYFLGALSGFFSGLALGAEMIVPFVISGFVCGIYIRKKRIFGILLFIVCWIPAAFEFFEGSFSPTLAVSLAWGALFWVAVSEIYLDKKRKIPPQTYLKTENTGDKKISEAIRSISLTLSGASKAKRREREERIKTVVDGIFCAECETCVGCTFPTEQLKKRLCQNIIKNQKISELDFSDEFKEKCNRWKFIEEKTNEIIKENTYKTSLRIDTLAEDYMSMARILSFGEKCAENRCYRDMVTANKLKLALELKNVRTQRVEICGTRLPLVEIYGIPFKMPFPEKAIKEETERVLGKNVQQVFFEAEEKTAKIGFRAVCPLNVDFYKISIPKKGEIICGDSICAFESEDGFFYSVISDGMGSGRDAAVCSRLGTTFLEKLISAGIDKACAVSMLGNVISSSEDEIFTTIDLLEVDLVRHKLAIIKAGAAPTWILRNKRVYSVSSRTLPCGIISGSSAEQTVLDCFSGDTVIMASDGGEAAVTEALRVVTSENKTFSSKEISFVLADMAAKKCGRNDDVSFCVVNIL